MLSEDTEESETILRARSQGACFVGGKDNPQGLRRMFEQQDGGEAIATWTPSRALEGFRGIIHGGVVSTVLDEAMSKAVAATGSLGVHRRAPSSFSTARTCSDKFLIRGWVVNENNRLSETEATLTAPDGTEYARAWARFLSVPKRSA